MYQPRLRELLRLSVTMHVACTLLARRRCLDRAPQLRSVAAWATAYSISAWFWLLCGAAFDFCRMASSPIVAALQWLIGDNNMRRFNRRCTNGAMPVAAWFRAMVPEVPAAQAYSSSDDRGGHRPMTFDCRNGGARGALYSARCSSIHMKRYACRSIYREARPQAVP